MIQKNFLLCPNNTKLPYIYDIEIKGKNMNKGTLKKVIKLPKDSEKADQLCTYDAMLQVYLMEISHLRAKMIQATKQKQKFVRSFLEQDYNIILNSNNNVTFDPQSSQIFIYEAISESKFDDFESSR